MQNLVTLDALYIYIYIYISTILQNKENINLINKVKVEANSTLKTIYKNEKENITLGN